MIREEEDDTTQETRQLIVLEVGIQLELMAKKIEEALIPITDEWTDGVNTGLGWAARIVRKDKSAS
jgi:hypothetical protein